MNDESDIIETIDTSDANDANDTIEAISASNVNMKEWCYPAVFHQEADGGYWVSFPDFPECFTQGQDTAEAREMAADALSSSLETGEAVPDPSPLALVSADGTSFVASVEVVIPSSKAPQVH